jgi:hypothetical protein
VLRATTIILATTPLALTTFFLLAVYGRIA